MKLPRRRFLHLAAGAAALPAVARIAWAQAYPTRPVKIVVPVGPSGSYDIVGRALADQLAKRLDQTVVVENRRRNGRRNAGGHPITGGRLHAARRWVEQRRV
jgi:tripartite-type tricarboxylate transporter receptor subunit TctC